MLDAPLIIAGYLVLGLAFAIYTARRLEPEDQEHNWTVQGILFVVTMLWPLFFVIHIYKSIKRGSIKKEGS
jgi:hypothetical protein